VKSVFVDCDADSVLIRVDQVGAACHTGSHSCFETHSVEAVVGERGEQ
jgi:phosphoribosyl-AMP cyclohydrolase